jgi:hypothetical protein
MFLRLFKSPMAVSFRGFARFQVRLSGSRVSPKLLVNPAALAEALVCSRRGDGAATDEWPGYLRDGQGLCTGVLTEMCYENLVATSGR